MLKKLLASCLFLFGTMGYGQTVTLIASALNSDVSANVVAGQTYIVACVQPPAGGPNSNIIAAIGSSPLSQHTDGGGVHWAQEIGQGPSPFPTHLPAVTIGYDTFASSGTVTFRCSRQAGPTELYRYVFSCEQCGLSAGSFFENDSGASGVTSLTTSGISASGTNITIACGAVNGNAIASATIAGTSATQITGSPCWQISNAPAYSSQSATLNVGSASEMSMVGVPLLYIGAPVPPSLAVLTGSIAYHNNTPFNGTLVISLQKASVLDTCTNPVQIVRQSPVVVPVVNGIVSGAPQFIPSPCISNYPYYVQLFDTKNNNVGNFNWYIMADSSGNNNAGDMVLSGFGGPIVVSVPLPIVSNPSGNQVVTQPVGTALSVNNLTVTGTLSYTGIIAASISGNAATATKLQTGPTQCSTGQFSTGIDQFGNAQCSSATIAGAAGGDLGGTYPNPSVTGANGGTIPVSAPVVGTNGSGQFFNQNGVLPNDISGNAATTTKLQTLPLPCAPGAVATGIDQFGNAICADVGSGTRVCNANGCYQVLGNGTIFEWGQVTTDINGGTVAVTFPFAFPNTCSTVTAATSGINDRITYIKTAGASSPACTTSGFVVGNNGSGDGATWTAFGW